MTENKFLLITDIDHQDWEVALPNLDAISKEIIKETLKYVKNNEDVDFLNLKKQININLFLSNDNTIQNFNKNYRDQDKATNVLSFSNIDNDTFEDELKLFDDIELGDIIIAYETLKKEATEKNIPFKNHFAHLLIHGILHLIGFDHIEDDEAEYMENFEIEILKTLGIDNPYREI